MDCAKQMLPITTVQSFVHASFWNKLSDLKLNMDKLNEQEKEIWGYFSTSSTWKGPVVEVDSTSFNSNVESRPSTVAFHGRILNKNTIEGFKELDKSALINNEGKRFMEQLRNGHIADNPALMNFFLIISFCDLKKFHFYYWFAFPVPHDLPLFMEINKDASKIFTDEEIQSLGEEYQKLDIHQKSYFLIHEGHIHTFKENNFHITAENYEEFYFAFFDRNTVKVQLKNYIIFLLYTHLFLSEKSVNFVPFTVNNNQALTISTVYRILLPSHTALEKLVQTWAGWEKNEKNKFAPRFSNMKATMDHKLIFEESVDLNLKLMKWRLLPDINLDTIKNNKYLLLGAGTLGCSVARTLLGWGVRNISFVDNSTVSFSNPVRQSLYTYEDSKNSKPKAQAATENLHKIFPGINSRGYELTIPMPGHTVSESTVQGTKNNYQQLKTLIEDHDVIFILTDSRESRWLPTVLGIYHGKIVINVALGFDSYLVMRYGCRNDVQHAFSKTSIPGNQLGCYFCNDVTAPGDSMKDRSLDQQCTVTRPGVSCIAGALAVELAISLTQHEKVLEAPAYYKFDNEIDQDQSILGILPHSIRGFLASYEQILPATPKYNQCIACSKPVLDEYEKEGFEFILKVLNSSKYLEDLTGLTSLMEDHNFADVVELDDSDNSIV